MKRFFDLAEERHQLIKEALLGAVAKAGFGLGRAIVKRPLTALNTAFNASVIGSAAGGGFRNRASMLRRAGLSEGRTF